MDLRLDISGATDLSSAFQRFPQETEADVHDAVVDSAGMIQVRARAVHRFVSRTQKLENNIETRFPNSMTGEVFVSGSKVPYAASIHNGSVPHVITAKNKTLLRWVGPYGFRSKRSVNHPGTKPDPFLDDAVVAKRGDIVARFAQAVGIAKQRVGL